MRAHRSVVIALAASAVALLGACSGDEPSASEAEVGTEAHIKVFAFSPNPLKVAVGDKVSWVNDDDITHTVTSGKRSYAPGDTGQVVATEKNGLFDMALDGVGKRASFTFPTAGTFHYFCDRHPGMEAEVVVAAPSGS